MGILRPGGIKIERGMRKYPRGLIFRFVGLMKRSLVPGELPSRVLFTSAAQSKFGVLAMQVLRDPQIFLEARKTLTEAYIWSPHHREPRASSLILDTRKGH